MKTLKLVLPAMLLVISYAVSAQDYAFKVLANKGNNEVKTGETWQPLKSGAVLQSGDEVRLGSNAYVGLVHNTGKPVEVKEPGVHKVSALESKVSAGSSVLNKYTDFILSSNSDESQQNRLSATGSVRRTSESESAIKVFLPEVDHLGIFNKTVVVNWDAGKIAGPYVVTVMNMFEDILVMEDTPESSYQIDLTNPKLANETAFLIEVSAKSDSKKVSSRHMIKKLTPAQLEEISAAIQEIRSEVSDETALNKLYLASFYEKKNLIIDAIYAYEQAVKLEPEVPLFKESYEEFLVRNHLK